MVENTTARDGHINSLSSSCFLHFSFIQPEPNVRTEEKLQVLSHNREQKKGSTLFTTLEKKKKKTINAKRRRMRYGLKTYVRNG